MLDIGYALSSEEHRLVSAGRDRPSHGAPPNRNRRDEIRQYAEAGFDHVYVHQIGPDQEGFFRFYADEVLPKLQ
jgi:hypothetical protein